MRLPWQACRVLRSVPIGQRNLSSSNHRLAARSKKSKKQENDAPLFLGRPKTNLKGGIVGLANVGKSTFFQALTRSTLGNPANYPYATIDPEEAIVVVPSPRFDKLCEIYNPQTSIPATLTVVDIAGLTRGASTGAGLGNAFLSNIRAVDGLFQVVRAFDDPDIIHIEKTVDPVRDLEIIRDELILKDMEFAMKSMEVLEKRMKGKQGNVLQDLKTKYETAASVLKLLEDGKKVAHAKWTAEDIETINEMSLLTAKPSVFIANVAEEEYAFGDIEENRYIQDVRCWVNEHSPGDSVIPVSIPLEQRIASLSPQDAQTELDQLGVQSMLPAAVQELRRTLHLISFFTCGEKEVREWSIREGTRAPEAAGAIHSDLQKHFILANVTKYDDVVALQGNESELKAKAKTLQKGKDYIMQDADVVYFKTSA